MKKIFISSILLFLCLFSFGIYKAEASEMDAEANGYTLSKNWIYVNDVTYDFQEVWGSTYYEGKMSSWMGMFTYLDEKTNEMFVLIMCTGMMMPNQESYWDQLRWNNQEMKIELYPEIKDTSEINLVNYCPKASEGTTSWSTSVGVSGEGLSVQVGQSYTSSEITVNTKLLAEQDNGVSISHNFVNYKTNTELENVCCNLVTKNNFAIFKIKNYNSKKDYNFYVNFSATFYRYGVINCSSVSDNQRKTFQIKKKEHSNHTFIKYISDKNGMTHTAQCSCGYSKTEPCMGFAIIGAPAATCTKCKQIIKNGGSGFLTN